MVRDNQTIHLNPPRFKKRIKLLFVLTPITLFVALLGFFLRVGTQQKKTISTYRPSVMSLEKEVTRKKIIIADKEIDVILAQNEQERAEGLSRKDSIDADGMLFVFDNKDIRPPFWMKDMRFAIDIIWIDDEKVVQIDSNVKPPEPNVPDDQLKLYLPNQPIDYVLELPEGFALKNGIDIGSPVSLP